MVVRSLSWRLRAAEVERVASMSISPVVNASMASETSL